MGVIPNRNRTPDPEMGHSTLANQPPPSLSIPAAVGVPQTRKTELRRGSLAVSEMEGRWVGWVERERQADSEIEDSEVKAKTETEMERERQRDRETVR